MQPTFEMSEVFEEYNRNALANAAAALSVAPVWKAAVTLPASSRLALSDGASRLYYRVREGTLELHSSAGPMLRYQRGDLAGVHE